MGSGYRSLGNPAPTNKPAAAIDENHTARDGKPVDAQRIRTAFKVGQSGRLQYLEYVHKTG